jgi:hypothetical protein
MGAGVAWLDYDGDGWLDLYLVQSGPFPPDGSAGAANQLWRNLGGGRFEAVGDAAGAGDRGYGQGVVAADLDGDRLPELYVANYGADALYRNRGDGTFAAVAEGPAADGWSSSAAFGDGDGDGDLDLYVTRYLLYDPEADLFCGDRASGERAYCDPSLFSGALDVYFENLGPGPGGALRFADATAAAGLAGADGRGLGVLFADLDDDGAADLYVANDLTLNLLFRNRGDGTFEDLSLLSGAAVNQEGKPEAGMGLALGDYDGDGDGDLAVTNFDVETNTLYLNHGAMYFEDASVASGFGRPSFNLLGFGLVAADFDLDGDLDLYAANGHIFERPRRDHVAYAQPDLLMLGDGRGGFERAECGPAFAVHEVGRGLAVADYDGDGDADLGVQNSGGPFQLLANGLDPGPERWLGVELVGQPPNRGAVGAWVELTTRSGRRQRRWVLAGESYQSSGDRRVLFGLAPGEEPAALTVAWPSGRRQRWQAPPHGVYLELSEPAP